MKRRKEKKPTESKATKMRHRRELVRKLYFQRYSCPAIADALRATKEYDGTELAALRFVQGEVKRIREEADPEAILALQRPAEFDRLRKGIERLFQIAVARAEDFELVSREKVSPKGGVETVLEERTPPQSRDRNLKLAGDMLVKLAKIENLITEKGHGVDAPEGGEGKETEKPAFIKFSGAPQDFLIAANLDRKNVN